MKQRILYYRRPGKNYAKIVRCLSEEGHKATKVGVYKFLRRYEDDNMIVCGEIRIRIRTSAAIEVRRVNKN